MRPLATSSPLKIALLNFHSAEELQDVTCTRKKQTQLTQAACVAKVTSEDNGGRG